MTSFFRRVAMAANGGLDDGERLRQGRGGVWVQESGRAGGNNGRGPTRRAGRWRRRTPAAAAT